MSEVVQDSSVDMAADASDQPIIVNAQFSFWAYVVSLMRIVLLSELRVAILVFIPFLALYELVFTHNTSALTMEQRIVILVLVVGLPLLVLGMLYLGWHLKQKHYGPITTFSVDATGIAVHAQDYKTRLPWAKFKQVIETPNYLFFTMMREPTVTVPIKDLSIDSLYALRTLAQQHVPYRLSRF